MTEDSYFNRKPRRGLSSFGLLISGFLGALIGAALVYVLFAYVLFPGQIRGPFMPDAKSPQDQQERPPLHQQDLATVEVVERVMPAVVGVNQYVYVTRFGQRSLVEAGSGSGVVISTDGYIVTNQHVIDEADQIRVVFPRIGYMEAVLVGEDVLTDLALLKIAKDNLTAVPLGDSTAARVGEKVLAVGNPLGFFQQTVTAGIISAVGRQVRIPDSQYAYTFLQTDAVINPGNSGGPLVNLRGEVIGINSAKVTQLGVEGIGLSIPSRTVQRVVRDLQEYGRVLRPQLGVLVEDLSQKTGEHTDQGVYIREIITGSPAAESGLQAGDVIIAVGDSEVRYLAQLFDALLSYYPGNEITVVFIRDDLTQSVRVTLGEM
ncbi:MAG: trypsin-like peptidase domain-containing protein [Bacillota bacterium]